MANDIPLEFTFRAIIEARRKIMPKLAAQAKRLITARVTETGKNIDGQPLGQYSEKYKKIREEKGRQTAFVNLTFRRDMLRNFNLIEQAIDGSRAVLGFPAPEERKKAEANTKRFSQFIGMTPQEQAQNKTLTEQLLGEVIGRSNKKIVIR